MTKTIVQIGGRGKRKNRNGKSRAAAAVLSGMGELNVRVELVRTLNPIGLEAVEDILQREVTKLAGDTHKLLVDLPCLSENSSPCRNPRSAVPRGSLVSQTPNIRHT